MKKTFLLLTALLLLSVITVPELFGRQTSEAQPRWIAFPGEFGIWSHQQLMMRRSERGQAYPTDLNRIDVPYGVIMFEKKMKLDKPERASIKVDGEFHIKKPFTSEVYYDYDPNNFELPAGEYTLQVSVQNFGAFPSIWFKSPSYVSDESWMVSSKQKDLVSAEALTFDNPNLKPSSFRLATRPITAIQVEETPQGKLFDFGKESFGFPVVHSLSGEGSIHLFYGESREEALAARKAETWDARKVHTSASVNDTFPSRAFRYILVQPNQGVTYSNLTALFEYLPLERKGAFNCSDTLLNRIYDVSYYTLELCTREVHIDGIKRDRWAWSGDAYQSYLMNFYTFFDEDVNRRTFWGLRGHEPQTVHLNTILDYTLYWIMGVYMHYEYTGDAQFVKQIYPRVKSSMEFCLGRLNENDMAQGRNGDWVFIDWSPKPIEKDGEVSFIQLLFVKSLEAMAHCADLVGDKSTAEQMRARYERSKAQFAEIFWSDQKGAYLHSRKDGKLSDVVTRYTNMFAVLFDDTTPEQMESIKNNVLLNNDVLAITTPYMKFYELAALCKVGEHAKALDFVRSYWGGILSHGATSIWEEYNPALPSDQSHYAMYNRPFGKSLCHAWGANPVYLFGRYFLGVHPTAPAYSQYLIEPHLGGLKWANGKVPTPKGDIGVSISPSKMEVVTNESTGGELRFQSKKRPTCKQGSIEKIGNNSYALKLDKANTTFTVKYSSVD